MPEKISFETEQLRPFNITEAAAHIRGLGKAAHSMEELACETTSYLFDDLITEPGHHKACALVRFFRTIEFQYLEPYLQSQIIEKSGRMQATDKFLVLLGTSGLERHWNRRQLSAEHQAIPIMSPEMVEQSPMIARLITQLGFEISTLFSTARSPKMRFNDPQDRDYNIFYEPDARTSPFIPSKADFVMPYAIRSVIGYGSLLPSGDLYAVIMFFRVLLQDTIAQKFTTLALSTTIAALSLPTDAIFIPE
jgi:two-component system NtrC family sensor kinase